MLTFAYYLLKVLLCSAIMYGYYIVALRNKRFHQYNRWYLLSAVGLSFLVPLIRIEFWKETVQPSPVMKVVTIVSDADVYVAKSVPSFWSLDSVALIAFALVSFVFLLSVITALIKIFVLIKRHPKKFLDKVCFVFSNTAGTPFSFFRYIFWNTCIDVDSDAGKHILKHELAHVEEKHSADKLFLNLALVIGWCNPFVWLIRRELNMIHEFIADQKAINNGDTQAFAEMLIRTTYPSQSLSIANSFFHSPIKRRLVMLTKRRSRFSYPVRLAILPLTVVVFVLFAFKVKEMHEEQRHSLTDTARTINSTSSITPYTQLGVKQEKGKNVIFTKDRSGVIETLDKEAAMKTLNWKEEDVDSFLSAGITIKADTIMVHKFDKVFTRAETPASYSKGNAAFSNYINANMHYPTEAIQNKTEGKVAIKFTVDEDGSLYNFAAVSAVGHGLENEAIRLLKNSAPWNPAIQNGRKVPFQVVQEMDFKLPMQASASDGSPAQYAGGLQEWRRYLERNVDLKTMSDHKAPEGKYKVTVAFTVGKDGSLSNIAAETQTGYGTEEAVIRAIGQGRRWQPSKQDGAFVETQVKQTLTFTITKKHAAYVEINSITVGDVKTNYVNAPL